MVLGFVQDALRADSETEWKLSLPNFEYQAKQSEAVTPLLNKKGDQI
jgi:hypothetical protein